MRKQIFTLILSLFVCGFSQAQVVFDPATIDAGSLPDGMTIVEMGGAKYLQVVLNGWESTFAVPAVTLDASSTMFKTMAMFKEGTSGYTMDQVNSFIQLAHNDPWETYGAIGAASSDSLIEYAAALTASAPTVDAIQVAGQETSGWDAISGDTLLIGYIVAYDPHMIFDPNMYELGAYGGSDAMTIVDIDGENYLKVELDGWNSVFQVSSTTLDAEYNTFSAVAKYEEGTSGYTIDQVNTFIQLAHNDPWATFGSVGAASSADLMEYTADITASGKVDAIQVAGQETSGWDAVAGDYLYIGKIMAYKYDNTVLFDPATFAGELGSGMEIVDIDGTKYLKVTSEASWEHTLTIDDYNTDVYNTITAEMKWAAGTSGLTADQSSTSINIQTTGGTSNAATLNMYPSVESFTTVESVIEPETDVNTLQFFVQQNEGSWPTVAGAEIYVGKIVASKVDFERVVPANTADINFTELGVTVDGLYDDAFDNSTENIVARVALGTVNGTEAAADAEVADNSDSYGVWYSAYDADNFYFYMDVNDDDPIDLGTSTQPWNNDGVELFVGIQDRRFANWDRVDGQQHQFRFNLGTEGPAHGADNDAGTAALGMSDFFGINDTTNIQYAIIKGSNGYSIELAIPWATFFRTSSESDNVLAVAQADTGIHAAKEIAFEVSILDASAPDTRKSILNWANNTGEDQAYNTTEFWGQITLKGPDGILDRVVNAPLYVYPNPANNYLNISMNNLASVQVYNVLGAQVLNAQMNNSKWLDVSTLTTGVYIVKATDAQGKVAVAKFNKQ